MSEFVPPRHKLDGFNCPLCGAFAHQEWVDPYASIGGKLSIIFETDLCYCSRCKAYSIWYEKQMIYPTTSTAPMANPDLPGDIKSDYEEARTILSASPRGAAALLRLAIQKLCTHLGEKGTDLNQDIGSLVKKGLPTRIQQSLDIVRVIGNNAVHPGVIDLKDDPKTAGALFGLVNLMGDAMITKPKEIETLYGQLPDGQKKQIAKRDGQP